jgi:hypothetical protein
LAWAAAGGLGRQDALLGGIQPAWAARPGFRQGDVIGIGADDQLVVVLFGLGELGVGDGELGLGLRNIEAAGGIDQGIVIADRRIIGLLRLGQLLLQNGPYQVVGRLVCIRFEVSSACPERPWRGSSSVSDIDIGLVGRSGHSEDGVGVVLPLAGVIRACLCVACGPVFVDPSKLCRAVDVGGRPLKLGGGSSSWAPATAASGDARSPSRAMTSPVGLSPSATRISATCPAAVKADGLAGHSHWRSRRNYRSPPDIGGVRCRGSLACAQAPETNAPSKKGRFVIHRSLLLSKIKDRKPKNCEPKCMNLEPGT